MSQTTGLQIEVLKPHVQAILDEVRRAGPDACRTARDEVEAMLPRELAKLPEELRATYASPAAVERAASVAQSCAGLYTLAAVAFQLYKDTMGDPDASVPAQYLLDAADYLIAAQAQGCS